MMSTRQWLLILLLFFSQNILFAQDSSWIRINLLGYPPSGNKIAVWASKKIDTNQSFQLVNAVNRSVVFQQKLTKDFGAYGPFLSTRQIDFTNFKKPGSYFIQVGKIQSPVFQISAEVYNGLADFCLRYLRQQRTGFNPFLKDSCHTHDGYTLYGPMPDSTHIDAVGGWHDASDYLQYSTTSANATFHLLKAYQDFPSVFKDAHIANGLVGKNGIADVLDEAKWGLDWLEKMHPNEDWLFNQIGDDRDHASMRIPKEDALYGKGFERPVYFVSGKPQQRGKYLNASTGAASTAGKFASAFALAAKIFHPSNELKAQQYHRKALSAYQLGIRMPGVAQTVSVKSPYIYAEGDWADDMELAAAQLFSLTKNPVYEKDFYQFLSQDSVAKWMGKDTAHHYQYYPFNNLGIQVFNEQKNKLAYQEVLQSKIYQALNAVAKKAQQNAFNRGVPFIWCSNNLTSSFAIAANWYRQVWGNEFLKLEQANFDWLFGCNPWGTSMVVGLPFNGDYPMDPHSAFTHLKNYPIDGGLVDGPVYTQIYRNLIGIQLMQPDEYASFQSDLAVYHDDYGDYSTNEPTMDGTASLVYLMASKEAEAKKDTLVQDFQKVAGAFIRGDQSKKQIALVFTGDEFGEGLASIDKTLFQEQVKASFYFTGRFYRNPSFKKSIQSLARQNHLLGPHSDQHKLYASWEKRDSSLLSQSELVKDLLDNWKAMEQLGLGMPKAKSLMIPPYEWWNQEVANWLAPYHQLFSFTPGLRTNADYTYPEMGAAYLSSDAILNSLKTLEAKQVNGLNGAVLLVHVGADPRRTDKFFHRLAELIPYLKNKGYQFVRADEMFQ